MNVRVASAVAVAVAILSVPSAPAGAQSEADVQQARALYQAGQAAADAERWSDAARNFERAYVLSGAPPALFNWAFALRSQGAFLQAGEQLETLLDQHRGSLDARALQHAESLLAEVNARLAQVVLTELDRATHRMRVDGRTRSDSGERPLRLLLDPGAHTLTLERPGQLPFEWQGELSDGEQLTISAVMRPLPATPIVALTGPRVEGRPLRRSPVFWTVAITLFVGAAVAVAIPLAARDADLAPLSARGYVL